jgi:LDH2 family malate/lactate/ureidoglycolate dehydrogenase
MRGATPMAGVDSVRVPGDGRAAHIDDYTANGVPLHNALIDNLNSLAGEIGIDPLT